jgi:hypothetical protein
MELSISRRTIGYNEIVYKRWKALEV